MDSDGEIDVSIFDMNPPVATLPGGQILTLSFLPTCSPALQTTIPAPLVFSGDPVPSFSDPAAGEVTGLSFGGAVEIYPGPRGDCNSTGDVTSHDIRACTKEIKDRRIGCHP